MKNWKTSLLGIAGAIFTACLPIIQNGTFDIHKDWPALVEAAGVAFFGFVAKDFNVTGTPKTDKDNGTTTE